MKILIFAAHPDDEVIGVGGTIVKHVKEGDEVYLSVLTDGVFARYFGQDKFQRLKERKEDCLKVTKYLGIKEVYFHDLPDAKLDTLPQLELNKLIESDIEKIKPDIVYTHNWSDLHRDHQLVFEATMVATRKNVKEVYCYEDIGSTNIIRGVNQFVPNVFVDISKEIKKKLKAMSYYKSTLEQFPSPLSLESLESLAKYRGTQSGLMFAEAFVCVKIIK